MKKSIFLLASLILISSVSLLLMPKAAKPKITSEVSKNIDVESLAKEIIEMFPQVSLFNAKYNIKEIKSEKVAGIDLYKVDAEIDKQEFTFYLTKDGKNVVFLTKDDQGYILRIISLENLKKMLNKMKLELERQLNFPKREKPEVKLFLMSFCPFGNQMENVMKDVIKKLKDFIDFEPVYIYYKNMYQNSSNYCVKIENDFYCSMHGIKELYQDLREKAVYRIYGTEKWIDFATEIDKECNLSNIETCWKEVAKKLNIDTERIEEYVEKNKKELILSDYEKSERYNGWASPMLFINGKEYKGPRDPDIIMRAICSSFEKLPEVCKI